jgi:hypothetical protein
LPRRSALQRGWISCLGWLRQWPWGKLLWFG